MNGWQITDSDTRLESSISSSSENGRISWLDRLVSGREKFLDLITGTDSQEVLNSNWSTPAELFPSDANLSAELKRFMDMVKDEAFDDNGYNVDYLKLRQSAAYREYRQKCTPRLREFDLTSLTNHSTKLAFWINLYNALIMDGVIASEVTGTVAPNTISLLGFFRKTAYEIGGMRVSADDIEHGILRGNRGHPYLPGPQFALSDQRSAWMLDPVDVRIHFALNCASRSCPPIQVYSDENIDQQLELAAGNFVELDLEVDRAKGTITISSIFKWYAQDFGGSQGVRDFIIAHLKDDEREDWLVRNLEAIKIKYKPYDWRLNSTKMGITFG